MTTHKQDERDAEKADKAARAEERAHEKRQAAALAEGDEPEVTPLAQPLANYAATYTLSAAEMLVIVAKCGNRANSFLKAMAPREASPNAVPTPLSEYGGVYTLSAAQVLPVMAALGPRQSSVMEAMYAVRAA